MQFYFTFQEKSPAQIFAKNAAKVSILRIEKIAT